MLSERVKGTLAFSLMWALLIAGTWAAVAHEMSHEVTVTVPADTTAPGKHPDALELELWSDVAGVPVAVTYAIAWQETRHNVSPAVRGWHGEWGRFQILPATAAAQCPGIDIRTRRGNLGCFLRIVRANRLACGEWRCAVRMYNGSGPKAEAYADSVMDTIARLVRAEMGD